MHTEIRVRGSAVRRNVLQAFGVWACTLEAYPGSITMQTSANFLHPAAGCFTGVNTYTILLTALTPTGEESGTERYMDMHSWF